MAKKRFPINLAKQRSQLPSKSHGLTPLSNAELNSAIKKIFVWITAHDKCAKPFQSSQSEYYPPISKYFSSPYICRILAHVCMLFKSEATLLQVNIPTSISQKIRVKNIVPELTICGDLHGSIKDLLSIFQKYGLPPRSSYIFLGDYVDRGKQSLAVILFLFLLKLRWPYHLFMLRGNHESFVVSSRFGFRRECKHHFPDDTVYGLFNVVFTYMPLAAIVEDHILCCHGGISQWIKSRSSIATIPRPILFENLSFVEHIIVTDLLWADPKPNQIRKFEPSMDRGCGFSFNEAGFTEVLKLLDCNVLVRGHESIKNGIDEFFQSKCYTVHSTALQKGDRAATLCLTIDNNKKKIKFEKRYHSYFDVKSVHSTCKKLNSEHISYRKIKFLRVVSLKTQLWPILKSLFDPRFHRRNLTSEDEIYLWVKLNAGPLFAKYVQSKKGQHPKLTALRVFPLMLSIVLRDKINYTNLTSNTSMFLKRFSRQYEKQWDENLRHQAKRFELVSSGSEDSDEELSESAENDEESKDTSSQEIDNQVKGKTQVNNKLPVRANLLSVYNSNSDSEKGEKIHKHERHLRKSRLSSKTNKNKMPKNQKK